MHSTLFLFANTGVNHLGSDEMNVHWAFDPSLYLGVFVPKNTLSQLLYLWTNVGAYEKRYSRERVAVPWCEVVVCEKHASLTLEHMSAVVFGTVVCVLGVEIGRETVMVYTCCSHGRVLETRPAQKIRKEMRRQYPRAQHAKEVLCLSGLNFRNTSANFLVDRTHTRVF